MNFSQQTANSYRIMQQNIASQMAALHNAQQNAINKRTKDLEESFAGGVPVHGKFLVNGPGEAEKDIWFNVPFTNVPVVTFGFEIKGPDNLLWTNNPSEDFPALIGEPVSGMIEGEAPIITALVIDWHVEEAIPSDQKYIGAKVVSVCDGPANTAFIVHWSASGMALSNPSSGTMAGNAADTAFVKAASKWKPPAENGSPLSYEAWRALQPPMVFAQDMVPDGNGGMVSRSTKYYQAEYAKYLAGFKGTAGWWNGQWYRADETPPGYPDDGAIRPQVQWRPGHAGYWNGHWYRADQTPPEYEIIVRPQVQWRPGSAGFWDGEWYEADETPPGYGG
jgi:hypothetical protein